MALRFLLRCGSGLFCGRLRTVGHRCRCRRARCRQSFAGAPGAAALLPSRRLKRGRRRPSCRSGRPRPAWPPDFDHHRFRGRLRKRGFALPCSAVTLRRARLQALIVTMSAWGCSADFDRRLSSLVTDFVIGCRATAASAPAIARRLSLRDGFQCGSTVAAGSACGCGCDLRLRLLRLWPPLHAIAERAQDRGKIFARCAGQRRHAVEHGEAAAGKRARRLRFRCRLRAKPAPGGSDRPAAPDIDAHRALAADPIAGGAVKRRIDLAIDRDRGAAAAGEMQQFVEAFALRTFMRRAPKAARRARAARA